MQRSEVPTGFVFFPLWIEASGLPKYLTERCKSPHAWLLFRKIVELDCQRHREPGTVEVSCSELSELTGLDEKKVMTTLKKLRKGGVLRSFLPDNDEEPGLFQVVRPLPTPVSWEEVRQRPELFQAPEEAYRYATEAKEAKGEEDPKAADPVLREIVDLYLDHVSMKMNAFILDELRLIRERFDLPLVKKVFERARRKEVQTLGWILREARREQDLKEKIDEERKNPDSLYAEKTRKGSEDLSDFN